MIIQILKLQATKYGGSPVELQLVGAGECDQQVWDPCTCTFQDEVMGSGGIDITCYQVAVADVSKVFEKIDAGKLWIFQLLDFTYDEAGIPDSLLGNTLVEGITIVFGKFVRPRPC